MLNRLAKLEPVTIGVISKNLLQSTLGNLVIKFGSFIIRIIHSLYISVAYYNIWTLLLFTSALSYLGI